jgi:multidrug efflux pump subunit AcrB
MDLNVYAQIGLIRLIGLASKNAVLIVEFAKTAREKGTPLIDAAVTGSRQRLRPILMTSFAFVLGCVPLLIATGSGAIARRVLGSVVVFGMLAATAVGIFVTPVLFVLFERIIDWFKKKRHPSERQAPHGPMSPVAGGGLVAPSDEGPGGNEGTR